MHCNEKQGVTHLNNQKNVRNERKLTELLLLLTFSSPSFVDSLSSSPMSLTDCKETIR